MKILVFGKSGQVAQELQRQVEVIALGRDEADLSDPEACAQAIAEDKADVVINAAAYTAVDKAEEEEKLATVINGAAPTSMAKACAKRAIPFIHISTDYVFDGSVGDPLVPDEKTHPVNAYGRSKLVGEEGVRSAGGAHAILRTSWVFSAFGNNFVKTMLRLGETSDELSVVSDQIGGPTSAADIAAACLSIAQQMVDGKSGGTFHFSGEPNVSWADFSREIFNQSGQSVRVKDILTTDYPTPAMRPLNSRLDCASLETTFGIRRPNWRDSLSKVLVDLKERAA